VRPYQAARGEDETMRAAKYIVAMAAVAAGVVVAADGDEYDVSAELAWKAACRSFEGTVAHYRSHNRLARVSEAKVYYSYDGAMKYYVVYLFAGREPMPTWREIERDPEGTTKNGWFQNVIINGTKQLPPCLGGSEGLPAVISQREEVKRRFLAEHPGEGWRYSRGVIELRESYFVFTTGSKEVLVNVGGEVLDPAAVAFRPDAALLADNAVTYRAEWEEIEEYERDEKIWTFVGPLSFSP
jgi:hypothetical protein